MTYAKILNNQVEIYPYSIEQLKSDNPNTLFPASITNDLLAQYGVFSVAQKQQPSYDLITQNIVELNPSLVNETWEQQWEVVAATAEEIAERKEQAKQNNKEKAENLLQKTDWTVMSDVGNSFLSNPFLANQQEFVAYRSQLRQIAVYPSFDSVFPNMPNEVWQTT